MRFVLAAHGTWGDVGPMAGLAQRLQARGASVHFVSTPYFEEKLQARGLATTSVGPMWDPSDAVADPRLSHPIFGPFDIWRLVFRPLVAPMHEATTAALGGRPGVVVLHPWCFGAQLAAEARGCPWAVVALAPVTWFSAADAPVIGPWAPPNWSSGALMSWVLRPVLRRVFGGDLSAEAQALGMERVTDRFFGAAQGAALNLAFWPEEFRAAVADDPPRAVLCGFPEGGGDERLEDAVEAFLAQGSAPVVMGLGSALPRLAGDVYDAVEEACVGLGLRAILVGAAPRDEERAGILRVPRAPYGALFPRGRLLIHHGGIGTTAEALVAGRPQLVIPFGADQYDNAARVERLGLGRGIPRRRVSARRMAQQLRLFLAREAEMRARAEALAAQLRVAEPGLDVAAARLWGLAR